MKRKKRPRAFSYRAGVRLTGTQVTCDGAGPAGDLVFLSHAQAVPRRRGLHLRAAGRQELLATEATLALLGREGERLRRRALPAPFGRPFLLGDLRLELCPTGHLPGSAALLGEVEGRPVLYAGSTRRQGAAFGAEPAEVRRAEALFL